MASQSATFFLCPPRTARWQGACASSFRSSTSAPSALRGFAFRYRHLAVRCSDRQPSESGRVERHGHAAVKNTPSGVASVQNDAGVEPRSTRNAVRNRRSGVANGAEFGHEARGLIMHWVAAARIHLRCREARSSARSHRFAVALRLLACPGRRHHTDHRGRFLGSHADQRRHETPSEVWRARPRDAPIPRPPLGTAPCTRRVCALIGRIILGDHRRTSVDACGLICVLGRRGRTAEYNQTRAFVRATMSRPSDGG